MLLGRGSTPDLTTREHVPEVENPRQGLRYCAQGAAEAEPIERVAEVLVGPLARSDDPEGKVPMII